MAGTVSKKRGVGKGAAKPARKASANAARPRSARAPSSAAWRKGRARPSGARRKRAPSRRLAAPRYHPGPPIADEATLGDGAGRTPGARSPSHRGDARRRRRSAAALARAGLCRPRGDHRLAAGLGRQRQCDGRAAAGGVLAVRRGERARRRRRDAARLAACRRRRCVRCGRSPRRRHDGFDLAALAALEAEAAHEALVAVKGDRALDGRHLPAVLPRPSRRLSRRRSRVAGGGADRARASRSGPTRASSSRSPSVGGRCAASRRGCCGPITAWRAPACRAWRRWRGAWLRARGMATERWSPGMAGPNSMARASIPRSPPPSGSSCSCMVMAPTART